MNSSTAEGPGLPILEASQVHKSFHMGSEEIPVLRGVNLRLHSGEIVVILGQSGVGKSTLLHILGTLERPTRGQIAYEGEDVSRWSDARLARLRNQRVGFVFQFHHLLPELTALENVLVPGLVPGGARSDLEAKARALLDEVGLSHRLRHKPSELSGGEQQRVAVARALFREPPIVLADEPTGNLDPETGEKLHRLIYTLARRRRQTWVIVTHNENLAALADKKARLEGGLLQALPTAGTAGRGAEDGAGGVPAGGPGKREATERA